GAADRDVTDRFQRTELRDGLIVLTEEMPGLRSASIGVWARSGPGNETPEEMGGNHLLGHMGCKGTRRRSSRDIPLGLERLGGARDAHTTREHTSFQARVLDEHIDLALDVLADLVLEPLLRAADLELEREVVLQELSTVEDTPDDLIFDLHAGLLWGEHPYGYNILGTRESVSRLTVEDLRRTHSHSYRRGNLVIAAAGNVQHERFVARVEETFAAAPPGGRNGATPPPSAVRPQ